jgi:glycosyltransferase involved in cell wall biosynthesis
MINCSNLKQGGGIQVADSICGYLNKYTNHHFVVVLSDAMEMTKKKIMSFQNVSVITYNIRNTMSSVFVQKDAFLDKCVKGEKIDVVLTVFGPARWRPRVPHLCGFARPHILPMDTPYFDNLPIKDKVLNYIVKKSFEKSAEYYWTESPAVTTLLQQVFPKKKVYTVSNTYNQVFDDFSKWKEHKLPPFKGITLLTVTNAYPHKNLGLALGIAKELKRLDPDFRFRFAFTIDEDEFLEIPTELKECFCFIGKVDISECPSLYQQADIMFQPTLLECFTATYPEAMRMDVPIVTSDLEFAHGLCGNAAVYYSPLDAEKAGEAIYKVATDNELRKQLVEEGKKQLKIFLDAEARADRLIQLTEEMGGNKN